MKKHFLSAAVLLLLTSVHLFSGEESKDLALQAIRSRNYDRAIAICLEQLDTHPDDSEYLFMLAQAYAYSQQRPKALDVLDRLMDAHPDHMDALLLWSRVHAWNKEYEAAENGYTKVLRSDPNNTEAKMGLAETASWKGDYSKAIDVYENMLQHDPSNSDLYYRLGRVYRWEGHYARAKENFKIALRLAPENDEYRSALVSFREQFRNRFEVRYVHRHESFSDNRKHYTDQSLVFLVPSPWNRGPFLFRTSQTRRLNERDNQFGLDYYPLLWKGAYGYFNLNYSPKARWYPQFSYVAEVYQSLLSSAELSLGYRRMNFEENPVSIYLGSLGYYFGNFYSYFRWYYSLQNKEHSLSWTVNVRRYFSRDNFVFVAYGQGSRPFDVATVDDFLITQSRILQAGATWYILGSIRIEGHLLYTGEKDGPDRTAFYLSTGYRW
jgi:YaiO family outer membrane protein